jgi:hypothetical protein
LIQHSFALQLLEGGRSFRGRTVEKRVDECFSLEPGRGGEFAVQDVAGKVDLHSEHDVVAHSPLAEHGQTTVGSRQMSQLRCRQDAPWGELPPALEWAKRWTAKCDSYEEPRFIFTDTWDDKNQATVNDYFVDFACEGEAADLTHSLLEVVAHKRSRLFGFRLANRFVNVMLPHAILQQPGLERAWFLQPLVSFVRGGLYRNRLRSTYALTCFLLPICADGVELRKMTVEEINGMTNAGWGYAASRPLEAFPLFAVSGPLLGYLSALTGFDLDEMCQQEGREFDAEAIRRDHDSGPFTLRQAVERIAFGVGLGVTRPDSDDLCIMHRVGNDVIVALGSARVSSVVVVEPELDPSDVRAPISDDKPFPEPLDALIRELAAPLRMAEPGEKGAREQRLDRPGFDDDIYAAGVIPARRCLVVASSLCGQCGSRESALMQAGSVAYMTLGAATAIGTMRDIDRRLEHLELADNPLSIAKIDAEVAADLGEIYDLDITRESYREMYRRLRDRLGIARDYKTLQDRMETLYRATSTFHAHKEERMLTVLTAAIVFLSVLILIGTIIIAGKPGA